VRSPLLFLARSPLARPPEPVDLRHRIIENPPPYPRLRRRGPASNIVFTRRNPAKQASHGSMSYPGESRQQAGATATERDISRRLLQSETAHEHNHEPPESRSRSPTSRVQLALNSEETSWRGWGPVRLVDDSFQGASWLPPSPSCVAAARTKTFTRHPPRFHEPGDGALANEQCRRSPPSEACPKADIVRCAGIRTPEGACPKLDPLEHLLSRYRFDLGWRARDQRS